MKKLIVIMALTLVSFSAQAQSKIGTIDADYILAQLPEIEAVNKGLETYNQELQADLDSTLTKYESLIKVYQDNNASWTEEEVNTKANEIVSLENEIKSFRQKAQVLIQVKRNELTQPLYEKINQAMLAVVNKEGYTQILHIASSALAYSAEGSDITTKVLAQLGIKVSETATAGDKK
mgnify:FL=1